MNIYFITSLLFTAIAALAAIDAASISFELIPFFNGIRWLRIHFITLGVITNTVFGLMPILSAAQQDKEKLKTRLDIWVLLNAGILSLLVGIPMINQSIIIAGGTLVFVATLLLVSHLISLRPSQDSIPKGTITSRHFYIAGLSYLFLGVFVGTGMWLGWNQALQMKVPIEVHIHANNWGFLSMVFAGLLIDLFPKFSGKELANPKSIKSIFWLMTVGAFGLVIGPWFQMMIFIVPGLLMHLAATIWLLINVIKPMRGTPEIKTPGYLHLYTSYVWIFAPILVAPMVLLKVPGFPGAGIEQNAPQALIYGWALQFGYALLPYLFARAFAGEDNPKLGGTWFSLITIHLGGVFLWISIFNDPYQGILHGTAYGLWTLSLFPILKQMWDSVRQGIPQFAQGTWKN